MRLAILATMRHFVRGITLEHVVAAWLAATIFAFACGSSSVPQAVTLGTPSRWGFLLVLCVLSLALAGSRPLLATPSPLVLLVVCLFSALAVASALWSVYPKLTFERGATFAVLMVTVCALGLAAAGREQTVGRLLLGVVAGAGAVAVAGALLLVVDYELAVQAGYDAQNPARYRGFGLNPNTAVMLFAFSLPLTAWRALEAARLRARVALGGLAALFFASLVLSGSRGAIAASLLSMLVLAFLLGRGWRRIAALVFVTAVYVGAVQVVDMRPLNLEYRQAVPTAIPVPQLEQPIFGPDGGISRPGASRGSGGSGGPGGPDGEGIRDRPAAEDKRPSLSPGRRFGDGLGEVYLPALIPNNPYDPYEIGRERPFGLTTPQPEGLFGTKGGRPLVWVHTFREALKRPTLGTGFGTEHPVFVNRFLSFQGGSSENAYIGLMTQLGMSGVTLFAVYTGLLIVLSWRLLRRRGVRSGGAAAACVAALVSGYALALFQSFFYSVGNILTLSFWLCGILLAAIAAPAARAPAARAPATPGSSGSSGEPRRPALAAAFAAPIGHVTPLPWRPARVPALAKGSAAAGLGRLHLGRAALLAAAAAAAVAVLAVAGRWESERATDREVAKMRSAYAAVGERLESQTLSDYFLDTYALYTCFRYWRGANPYALQVCFTPRGELVESADERSGKTVIASIRANPEASGIRVDPSYLNWLVERIQEQQLGLLPVEAK